MANFIQGDNFDRPGGKSEKIVWERLKDSLSQRDVLGYSRYPLFSKIGERRKEPDILFLDKEWGIVVIEVKGYTIQDIENIEPNLWTLINLYEKTSNPIAQAEDYLYALKSRLDIDRSLRKNISGKSFVALPQISKSDWNRRGFDNKIDSNYIIFKEDSTKSSFINKISSQVPLIRGNILNDEQFRIAKSILGHESNHISSREVTSKENTKGCIIDSVSKKLHDIDIQQESIAKSIAPGPQRIRGIAGSGKTVLLCQKAAIMNLRYPQWKIAVVFFTQSLYDNIISTIDMYMKAFSNGEVSYDTRNSNLQVLHAWGRKDKNGFYKEITNKNNCKFRSVSDVNSELGIKFIEPNNGINYISKKLLEETNGKLEQIYDAILIDEGQDLIGDDEFKYNDKQSFYYMAYKSLKPIEYEDENLGRLVWAYDELQSLNDKKIPTSEEVLGDRNLVTGIYKGGIKKSEKMKKCYRTPYHILTSAHAVGMGFFRYDSMISGYTRKDEWEDIGYEVIKGDFRKIGSEIILKRPIENSPNPINEFYKGNTIELKTFNSEIDMIDELAQNIKNDIKIEGLNPSRDILIINLNDSFKSKDFENAVGKKLNDLNIDFYIPSMPRKNQHDCDKFNLKQPDKFWLEGAVTLSRITRAKGNEAPMVYVIGLEYIANNEGEVKERNKLFTAMTRSKCWLKLMGVGNYTLYEEIEKSIECNGTFKFKYTKPKKENNDSNESGIVYSV